MYDETEEFRRDKVIEINAQVETSDKEHERIRLSELYGSQDVWDTDQLREQFDVVAFMAPYCSVIRKSDGAKGSMQFQHSPRFYFNFRPA